MSANSEIKAILKEYREKYENARDAAYDAQIAQLQTNERKPAKSAKIVSAPIRADFQKDCAQLRERARQVFERETRELARKVAAAPSTDAVNAITLAAARSSVTENEIKALLSEYGENVQARNAIVDVARKNRLEGFEPSPTERQFEEIKNLQKQVESSLDVSRAENGSAAGFVDFMGMFIDAAFPPEE